MHARVPRPADRGGACADKPPDMETENLISYSDVLIRHGDCDIVKGVTLSVSKGDFVYIIGPVGAGKSSILRTMYADLRISGGTASVLGWDMAKIKRKHIPELRRKEGIIFQDYKLLGDMSIRKNLEFVLRATGMKQKSEIRERVRDALERTGLTGKEGKYPDELSGGEQQRAAIARAILNDPLVILADEPTGNLDKNTALGVTQLLAELNANGTAVIMSTHNLDLINKFTGKVYRCSGGAFEDATDDFCEPLELKDIEAPEDGL